MATSAPAPVISGRGLTVTYGQRCALHPIDLDIAAGESVAVVGRNGSGKSSLLRAICGLEPAARGEVVLHAEGCHHRRTIVEIAYVPQRSGARWDLPFAVGDVVAAGRRRAWWRRPGRADRAAVDEALAAVGLGDLASRSVAELSGGQAQRVLLARALVQRPDVMIMDEPFAGLDLATVDAVVALLARLVDGGTSVCCALHELDIARSAFTRAVALADGRVVADGVTDAVLDAAGVERIFTLRAATA
ncbi:zinc ABC transporter ATP-binding protein [Mycobacterium antarcticum]|uniref:metal ABC transporter ATP-binding protein n=1 Tax=Mycolicibacterium sp. TUM20983 TaxID=3023369 RepID=UPI00238C1E00|nr:metal ABC transporter ATP-binding protein [Mycolicibacterium sp. TUM20983]GLP73585.1 zinc ABC transporter ATP-binding protein [Mycolicibacterium sp. TUM20983]